jgi:hypothetical protein
MYYFLIKPKHRIEVLSYTLYNIDLCIIQYRLKYILNYMSVIKNTENMIFNLYIISFQKKLYIL